MSRISVSQAREELADALNRVAYTGERILIHRRGKNVGALVSVDDAKFLQRLEDKLDLEMARAALADAEKFGTIPWSQIKKELERKRRRSKK